MTFSLPAFPQPLVPSIVWLGRFLLPQANQNVNAEDCREASEGELCCAVHQCEPETAAPCPAWRLVLAVRPLTAGGRGETTNF